MKNTMIWDYRYLIKVALENLALLKNIFKSSVIKLAIISFLSGVGNIGHTALFYYRPQVTPANSYLRPYRPMVHLRYTPELIQKSVVDTKLRKIENAGNYYSFEDVTPAFGPVDFTCLTECTKGELQDIILSSIPENLRKRVHPILGATLDLADRYDVDPFWVLAIMWTESHFNHSVVSQVGAKGYMQIMPQTGYFLAQQFKDKGIEYMSGQFRGQREVLRRLYHRPLVNIEMGVYYLRFLQDFFSENTRFATVAYNMGPYGVKQRLRRGLPVGVRNEYLDKVRRHYKKLTQFLVSI